MRNQNLFAVALAILLATGTASATPILLGTVVRFELTAVRQNLVEAEVRPEVYRSTLERVRITNRDILQFIAYEEGVEIPPGTQLWVDRSSEYLVAIDPHGNVIAGIPFAVTASSSFEQSTVAGVLKGFGKIFSQAQAGLGYGMIEFLLDGLLTEQFQRVNGLVYLSYSADLTHLTGPGSIDATNFLFTGSITGQRPGTGIPPTLNTWIPEEI